MQLEPGLYAFPENFFGHLTDTVYICFFLTALRNEERKKEKTNSSDRKPLRQRKRREESQRKKHGSDLDKDRKKTEHTNQAEARG